MFPARRLARQDILQPFVHKGFGYPEGFGQLGDDILGDIDILQLLAQELFRRQQVGREDIGLHILNMGAVFAKGFGR